MTVKIWNAKAGKRTELLGVIRAYICGSFTLLL